MQIHFKYIFALIITIFHVASAELYISSISASYGANCGAASDRSSYFNTACSSGVLSSCSYVFSMSATGGDPHPGCAKQLAVSYSCATSPSASPYPASITFPAEADGLTITIDCTHVNNQQTGFIMSGLLCGWHYRFASPASQGEGAVISQDAACGGYNPASGCPSGFSAQYICDDDGNWCSSYWITCVSYLPIPLSTLPNGVWCGALSGDVGSNYGNYATYTSSGIGCSVQLPNSGLQPTALQSQSAQTCPSGFTLVSLCDATNGQTCFTMKTCAYSSGSVQSQFTGYPSNTLCGALHTYGGQSIQCNGQTLGLTIPVSGCPTTASAWKCDDAGGNYCQGGLAICLIGGSCSSLSTTMSSPSTSVSSPSPAYTSVAFQCASRTYPLVGGSNPTCLVTGIWSQIPALSCQYTAQSCSGHVDASNPSTYNTGACVCSSPYYNYQGSVCAEYCGDGTTQSPFEECDYALTNTAPGCSPSCLFTIVVSLSAVSYNSLTLTAQLPTVASVDFPLSSVYYNLYETWPTSSASSLSSFTVPSQGAQSVTITLMSLSAYAQYYVQAYVTTNPSATNAASALATSNTVQLPCGCLASSLSGSPVISSIYVSAAGQISFSGYQESFCSQSIAVYLGATFTAQSQPLNTVPAYGCGAAVSSNAATLETVSQSGGAVPGATRTYSFMAPGAQYSSGYYPNSAPVTASFVIPFLANLAVYIVTSVGSAPVSGVTVTFTMVDVNGHFLTPLPNTVTSQTVVTTSTGLAVFSSATLNALSYPISSPYFLINVSKTTYNPNGPSTSHVFTSSSSPSLFTLSSYGCPSSVTSSSSSSSCFYIQGGITAYQLPNQLTITDQTSYPLSGTVMINGYPECPVLGASISVVVNGIAGAAVPVQSNGVWTTGVAANSQFKLVVSLNTSFPHTFAYQHTAFIGTAAMPDPQTTSILASQSITNINFLDTTTSTITVNLYGNAACRAEVGAGTLVGSIQSCLVQLNQGHQLTFGQYGSAVIVPATTIIAPSSSFFIATSPLSPTQVNYMSEHYLTQLPSFTFHAEAGPVTETLVYTSPPILTVENVPDCSGSLNYPSPGTASSPSSFFALTMSQPFVFSISVYEEYAVRCDLVSYTVTLIDDIGSASGPCASKGPNGFCTYTLSNNKTGSKANLQYTTIPGLPNLSPAPNSGTPTQSSTDYAKYMTVSVNSNEYVGNLEIPAVVQGQIPKNGGFYDSYSLPKWDPVMIIRDPPGGLSFAQVQTSLSINQGITLSSQSTTGTVANIYAGIDAELRTSECTGVAAGALQAVCNQILANSVSAGFASNIDTGGINTYGSSNFITYTTTSTMQTSSYQGIVNGTGDLFLVPSIEILFAESNAVTVQGMNPALAPVSTCNPVMSSSVMWIPASINNGQALTFLSVLDVQNEITSLTAQLANNASLTPDIFVELNSALNGWTSLLAVNDVLKEAALPWTTVDSNPSASAIALNKKLAAVGSKMAVPVPNSTTTATTSLPTAAPQLQNTFIFTAQNPQPSTFTDGAIMDFYGGGSLYSFSFQSQLQNTYSNEVDFYFNKQFGAQMSASVGVLVAAVTSDTVLAELDVFHSTASSSSTTNTFQITYTLGDPNVGDHFQVQILRDPIFNTPIFKIISGSSMCPAEPFTVAREVMALTANPTSFQHISPDNSVPVTLVLENTGIPSTYNINIDALSSSTGAVITLDGLPALTNAWSKAVNPGALNVGMVVKRGPFLYNYVIDVEAQSACEAGLSNGIFGANVVDDVQPITISFDHSCIGVKISGNIYLTGTFIVNGATIAAQGGDAAARYLPVTILNPEYPSRTWLTEFTVILPDSNVPYLTAIYVEYSLSTQPGTWYTCIDQATGQNVNIKPQIVNEQTGPESFTFNWQLPAIDGTYQLRARSSCDSADPVLGSSYSIVYTGIIQTTPPTLFNTLPSVYPLVGSYNPGDPISFTFTKPISCAAVYITGLVFRNTIDVTISDINHISNSTALSLFNQTALLTLSYPGDFPITCSGSTLSISLITVPYEDIMQQQVLLSVNGVEDQAGNVAATTAVTFIGNYVNLATEVVFINNIRITNAVYAQVAPGTPGNAGFISSVLSEVATLASAVLSQTVSVAGLSVTSMTPMTSGAIILTLECATQNSLSSSFIASAITRGLVKGIASSNSATYSILSSVTAPAQATVTFTPEADVTTPVPTTPPPTTTNAPTTPVVCPTGSSSPYSMPLSCLSSLWLSVGCTNDLPVSLVFHWQSLSTVSAVTQDMSTYATANNDFFNAICFGSAVSRDALLQFATNLIVQLQYLVTDGNVTTPTPTR